MNCEKCLESLSAYIDSEFSEKIKKEIEEHLDICKSCKKEYIFLKDIVNSISELPFENLPPDFEENLHRKLIIAKSEKKVFRMPVVFKAISLAAAGFLLIFIIKTGIGDFNTDSNSAMETMAKSASKAEVSDEIEMAPSIADESNGSEENIGSALSEAQTVFSANYKPSEDIDKIKEYKIEIDRNVDSETDLKSVDLEGKVIIEGTNSYHIGLNLNSNEKGNDKLNALLLTGEIYSSEISDDNYLGDSIEIKLKRIKTDNIVKTMSDISKYFEENVIEVLEVFNKEEYNINEITIKLNN